MAVACQNINYSFCKLLSGLIAASGDGSSLSRLLVAYSSRAIRPWSPVIMKKWSRGLGSFSKGLLSRAMGDHMGWVTNCGIYQS